jgi:exportin-2 (importin alpha re-exporter)
MESILFPPFQYVLQLEILEFTPYVFQVLAQLLEYRPHEAGLGEAYTTLFPPLLTASLWEKTGNVPGLTRLIQGYLKHAASDLVAQGRLTPLLGIFQKLNASKATESDAFDLLSSLTQFVAKESMAPFIKTIFTLIMTRLQATKSNLYPIRATQYFGLFCGIYGGEAYVSLLNEIQPGIVVSLVSQIWLPKLQGASSSKLQAKAQVIGLTRFLSDSSSVLQDDNGKHLFAQIILGIMTILTSPTFTKEAKDLPDETPNVYDAFFSQLKYAKKIPDDAFENVADPVSFFLTSLSNISTANPGLIGPIIQQGLSSDPKLSASLQSMCQSKGVNLV